jgi:hypothetical protein
MKNIVSISILICALALGNVYSQKSREWYELKVYTFNTPAQEKVIDSYLKDAYIPAMHKLANSTIGVFKPVETDTAAYGKKIYVLVSYSNAQKFHEAKVNLNKELQASAFGKDYIDAPHDNAPFKRAESILMYAFEKQPTLQKPKLTGNRSERVYELRSYEGPTEKKSLNKIKMFNDGDEVGLFNRLNFNAVFYAEVWAGSRMPNLMYMTTFDNMKSRDDHWAAFRTDPQWEKLKVMPEYQNNVSKIDIMLLRPTEYSDY